MRRHSLWQMIAEGRGPALIAMLIWTAVPMAAFGAERVVLCEEFSSTNCTGCASAGAVLSTMLDAYPETFTLVQIHVGDAYTTTWGQDRWTFYQVPFTPTAWFDGVFEMPGETYPFYEDSYLARRETPTDVTIELSARQAAPQEYEVTASVCLEPAGVSRPMTLHMVQVLDNYPVPPSYSRNCFRQAASTADIQPAAGECVEVTRTFTFGEPDWSLKEDIQIVAWVQEPGMADPPIGVLKEVYQAAFMTWPFPGTETACGDYNGDGDVDLGDFATFAQCYFGAGVTIPPPGCSPDQFADSDCDGDGDVDLGDFSTFAVGFTG